MKKITILLADDHQIILDGLQSFLAQEAELDIVGTALNGEETLQLLQEHQVDVAVLDINMPKPDGLELARIIRKQYPKTKVILLTMIGDGNYILKAMQQGIDGYVIKERSKDTLIGAIHAVYRGATFFPPDLWPRVQEAQLNARPSEEEIQLTIREKEVICLLVEDPGLSNKEIAERMFIAEFTVQTHFQNARKKLGAKTKGELIKYAMEHGLCGDLNKN